MAQTLGEPVGKTVGYRIQLDNKTGPDTIIEVVTEGVLTRMLLADPSLAGIGAVIFDEFHERSLHADTALAFTRETLAALRPDLRVVVMSATLDAASLAARLRTDAVIARTMKWPCDDAQTLALPSARASTTQACGSM